MEGPHEEFLQWGGMHLCGLKFLGDIVGGGRGGSLPTYKKAGEQGGQSGDLQGRDRAPQ